MTQNSETQNNEFLNDLLGKALDAEAGYKLAAYTVEDTLLQSIFRENAVQRAEFASELKKIIVHNGGDPDSTTSTLSKLHRVWIGLKGWATSADDTAVLEECERGEQATLEEYESVLSNIDQMPEFLSVVERQRDRVRKELNTIKEMREASK